MPITAKPLAVLPPPARPKLQERDAKFTTEEIDMLLQFGKDFEDPNYINDGNPLTAEVTDELDGISAYPEFSTGSASSQQFGRTASLANTGSWSWWAYYQSTAAERSAMKFNKLFPVTPNTSFEYEVWVRHSNSTRNMYIGMALYSDPEGTNHVATAYSGLGSVAAVDTWEQKTGIFNISNSHNGARYARLFIAAYSYNSEKAYFDDITIHLSDGPAQYVAGWYGLDPRTARSTLQAFEGTASLSYTTTGAATEYIRTQSMHVRGSSFPNGHLKGGEILSASGMIRQDTGTARDALIEVQVSGGSQAGSYSSAVVSVPSGQWTLLENQIVIPEDANSVVVWIYFTALNPDEVFYFDRMRVQQGEPLWEMDNGFLPSRVEDAHIGTHSMMVQSIAAGDVILTSPDHTALATPVALSEDTFVAVEAMTEYVAGAFVKSPGARNVTFTVIWYDADRVELSVSDGAVTATNAGSWTSVQARATSPAGAKYARLRLTIAAMDAFEFAYIDMVAIAAVHYTVPDATRAIVKQIVLSAAVDANCNLQLLPSGGHPDVDGVLVSELAISKGGVVTFDLSQVLEAGGSISASISGKRGDISLIASGVEVS